MRGREPNGWVFRVRAGSSGSLDLAHFASVNASERGNSKRHPNYLRAHPHAHTGAHTHKLGCVP